MPEVVISYSHQDEVWMRRLLTHLKPFEVLGMLWVFSDALAKVVREILAMVGAVPVTTA